MFYRPDSTRLMVLPVALLLAALAGILVLAMLACALTTQFAAEPPDPTPPPTQPVVDVVVVPQEPAMTPTPQFSLIMATLTAAAPRPSPTPGVLLQQPIEQPVVQAPVYNPPAIVIPANCVVRTDWVPYTVQPGDTVGALAIATNTPLVDIVLANCLRNPDLIQAGQVLYLPRVPVSYAPAPIAVVRDPNTQIGFVLVEPALVQSGAFLIDPGDITLRALGVNNARRVAFYMAPIGTDAEPVLLGIDENMTDGAAIIWRVPAEPLLANVWAIAVSPDELELTTPPILVVNDV